MHNDQFTHVQKIMVFDHHLEDLAMSSIQLSPLL